MTPEEIAAMQAENARLKEENGKLKQPSEKPSPSKDEEKKPKDESLNDKVDRENREKADRESSGKKLEAALRFDLNSDKFISDHKALLPKNAPDLFAAAAKETYDSVVEKVNATKSAVIQSFFREQANLEMTTASQREAIEEYLKGSKKAKEDEADHIWRNVFEPVLEMIKRLRKAEEVNRANNGMGNDSHNEQLRKMEEASRKKYLGEK